MQLGKAFYCDNPKCGVELPAGCHICNVCDPVNGAAELQHILIFEQSADSLKIEFSFGEVELPKQPAAEDKPWWKFW